MANPEKLALSSGPDLCAEEDQKPIAGKSFANLQRFLTEATAPVRYYPQGVQPDYSDRKTYYPQIRSNQTFEGWQRNLTMTYDYVFGEEVLAEIARRNRRITHQAVQQIIARTVRALHKGADQATRARFRVESFDFSKPRSLASRQRLSKAKGGISLEIAARLAQGATLDTLKKDFTTWQITKARRVLEDWGDDLPRERNPILPQFQGLANPKATDQERQALLSGVRNHQLYLVLHRAGLLVNLTSVAKKAGLRQATVLLHFAYESLQEAKLPLAKVPTKIKDRSGKQRIVYYNIIAAIDEQKAIAILRRDPALADLRINPARLVAGPASKAPNTTELMFSGN